MLFFTSRLRFSVSGSSSFGYSPVSARALPDSMSAISLATILSGARLQRSTAPWAASSTTAAPASQAQRLARKRAISSSNGRLSSAA